MTAEELRSFVRDALERLDDEPRRELVDALLLRAVKGGSGWKPSGPSRRNVAEALRFAEAARRIGSADPDEVDGYLRQGTKALLAGEHATARAILEALLPAVGDGEIDLGQHEMVDEVLTVDVQECAAQYVASVYLTTPLEDRSQALSAAMDAVHGVASFWQPIAQMERAAAAQLPELDTFLPGWVEFLERQPPSQHDWEGARGRWLREAVLLLEGVQGLERIARKTKRPEELQAWCEVLVERGDWADALRAYDDATKLVAESRWRAGFLDGAALAAQQLGRHDSAKRVEAAWLGAPSLLRLLRWLGAANPTAATLGKRAREAIRRCPRKEGRQLGLLHVLTGDVQAAAKLLVRAPGLGWSSEDHPGHVLFPAFAGLLAEGVRAKLAAELFASLREAPHDLLDMGWNDGDRAKARPKLSTPSIAELIAEARPAVSVDPKGRAAILEAMRAAATKRVDGILGNKRRRYYGHAATLVACCLELAPAAGRQKVAEDWVRDLRKRYSRFYAFRKELDNALASTSRNPTGCRPRSRPA
jgi:tetratricopeptide (TPR) repeat protein